MMTKQRGKRSIKVKISHKKVCRNESVRTLRSPLLLLSNDAVRQHRNGQQIFHRFHVRLKTFWPRPRRG